MAGAGAGAGAGVVSEIVGQQGPTPTLSFACRGIPANAQRKAGSRRRCKDSRLRQTGECRRGSATNPTRGDSPTGLYTDLDSSYLQAARGVHLIPTLPRRVFPAGQLIRSANPQRWSYVPTYDERPKLCTDTASDYTCHRV